jgi:hypothetical protein
VLVHALAISRPNLSPVTLIPPECGKCYMQNLSAGGILI